MTVDIESYANDFISLIGAYLEEKGITRANPVDNTGSEYENNVFFISAYNWNEEDDPMPNFWYKPLNYQVEWYKHLGRGTFANRPITIDEAYMMFQDCINSLSDAAAIVAAPEDDFWEIEDEE